MMHETPEIECTDCAGYGHRLIRNPNPLLRGIHDMTCEACNGMGWRAMTEDEEADAAEEQHRLMCEGEPPLSMQEAYEIAFQQSQESRA